MPDVSPPQNPAIEVDPRIYMAAERTFLAWIRTGIAIMGFGFVIARFGLFLKELALQTPAPTDVKSVGVSVPLGVGLIVIGIVIHLVSVVRHRSYIRALDENRFRDAFGSGVAIGMACSLAIVGAIMAGYLILHFLGGR